MPELIDLGGGIIDEHYDLLSGAAVVQLPRATMVPRGGTAVIKALLGGDAGLVGAASLAFAAEDGQVADQKP